MNRNKNIPLPGALVCLKQGYNAWSPDSLNSTRLSHVNTGTMGIVVSYAFSEMVIPTMLVMFSGSTGVAFALVHGRGLVAYERLASQAVNERRQREVGSDHDDR